MFMLHKVENKKEKAILDEDHQLDSPITKFTYKEISEAIWKLDLKKAPDYDLITSKLLRELSEIDIKFLTIICNSIL